PEAAVRLRATPTFPVRPASRSSLETPRPASQADDRLPASRAGRGGGGARGAFARATTALALALHEGSRGRRLRSRRPTSYRSGRRAGTKRPGARASLSERVPT